MIQEQEIEGKLKQFEDAVEESIGYNRMNDHWDATDELWHFKNFQMRKLAELELRIEGLELEKQGKKEV